MTREQISGKQFSSGAIIIGGNCPGGNFHRGQLSGEAIIRGAIIQEVIIRGKIFLRCNCLRILKHLCGDLSLITAWRHLTGLVNFVKFLEIFFCRTPSSNHFSHDVFFSFCRSVRLAALNQFIWWSSDKLGEGILKPVQCCAVMEIRWNLPCQVMAKHVPT